MKAEITVQFQYSPSPYHMGDYRMKVIKSNIPQYTEGQHFDFGKMEIEARNGVKIIVLPS